MNVNKSNGPDIHIKNVQEYLSKKSKEVFTNLRNEIDPSSNEIDLDRLRSIMSLYGNKSGIKDNVKKIISNFHLKDKLMTGQINNKSYNEKINEADFCNFVTGKEIKRMLYQTDLSGKKDNVEELYTLYSLMGGTRDGISKDSLRSAINKVLEIYSDVDSYIRDTSDQNQAKVIKNNEAEEIIAFLSSNSTEKLSLEDFVNAMTSEFIADFDDFKLE
jgi:hypothetical protein